MMFEKTRSSLRPVVRPTPVPHVSAEAPAAEPWWPWQADAGGAVCEHAAMLVDAMARRLTLLGSLRACCVVSLARVLDFQFDITPGDCSVDLSGVTALDPQSARVLVTKRDLLPGTGSRLTVTGASAALQEALRLAGAARVTA